MLMSDWLTPGEVPVSAFHTMWLFIRAQHGASK